MRAHPLDGRADARLDVVERPERHIEFDATRLRALGVDGRLVGALEPHPVWPMTTISSVPSSVWLMISERMTSSVARPPALRMMWASPVRRPSVSSTSSLASMQATMAMPRSGAAVSADRSKDSVYRSFSARILPTRRGQTRAPGSATGAEQQAQPALERRDGGRRAEPDGSRPGRIGRERRGAGGEAERDLVRAAEAVAARLLEDEAPIADRSSSRSRPATSASAGRCDDDHRLGPAGRGGGVADLAGEDDARSSPRAGPRAGSPTDAG